MRRSPRSPLRSTRDAKRSAPRRWPLRVESERLDLTEFVGKPARGHAHLVTQAWERLEDVFIGLGFQVAEGPEVETDWHNFEALNMPVGHPARGEWDTLFVDHVPPGGEPGTTVLRTHTSPVQIRTMLESEPPIYIVAPGPSVPPRHAGLDAHARVPSDRGSGDRPRHHDGRPRRHDRGVHQGVLRARIHARDSGRASSPSPNRPQSSTSNVPTAAGSSSVGAAWCIPTCCVRGGLDPEQWSGFAFGFGIDRMAKERHGVDDIREMYTDDIRFLEQF